MSKVVVNQLQHSTGGSAPALTWWTADGSSDQIAKLSDGSGTLGWASGVQPMHGNGTLIKFPNTFSTGKIFQTDGSASNLSYLAPPTPFTTKDGNQQGWRLCDRYERYTNGTPQQIILTVPTQYTTNAENVMAYRIIIRGLRFQRGSSGSDAYTALNFKPTSQDGTPMSYSVTANHLTTAFWSRYNSQTMGMFSTTPGPGMALTGNQTAYYPNAYNVLDTAAFDSATANNSSNTANNSGSEGMIGQIDIYNGKWSGLVTSDLRYQNRIPGSGTDYPSMNIKQSTRHYNRNWTNGNNPMGFSFTNSAARTYVDGMVELYAVFKNGVVS
tara:strand:+ start:2036 stop:3016 length:981 start_codon:yes stop_codon:yes gene_type:complete